MSIKDIVYNALFAAICTALGVIPPIFLPFYPVPITAQSLGPMLAGSILGAKKGALSCILFILIMLTGLPIMAGARAGIGIIMGPTGGFILCFPLSAYIIGLLLNGHKCNVVWTCIYIIFGGIIVLYVVGVLWVSMLFDIQLHKAFLASLMFLPGDIIKAILAATTSVMIKKSYPLIKH